MSEKRKGLGFCAACRSGYSSEKEVMRMTHARGHRLHRRCLRHLLVLSVVAILAVGMSVLSLGQEEPFVERVLGTLITLPDEYLPALVELMGILDVDEEARRAFLDLPREFLVAQGFVSPIDLPPDSFQVAAIDFSVPPAAEDEIWFGVAEPLEGLVFEPKGLGVLYGNVGVFIQEAHDPVDEPAGATSEPLAVRAKEDVLRFITERFSGDSLERLRILMKELDRMAPEDPQRQAFLDNPREYILAHELTLPASTYRIVSIDLNRAEAVDAVRFGEIRAGLAVVPEGIGVFFNTVGAFLQLAI